MKRFFSDLTNSADFVFDPLKIAVANGRASLVDATAVTNDLTLATANVEGVRSIANLVVYSNRRDNRLKFLVKSGSDFYKYNQMTGQWVTAVGSYVEAQLLEVVSASEALGKLPAALGDIFDFSLCAFFYGDPTGASPYISQVSFDYEQLPEGVVDVVDFVTVKGREIRADGGSKISNITATLSHDCVYSSKVSVAKDAVSTRVDANGNWELKLVPNHNADSIILAPANGSQYSFYTIKTSAGSLEVVINKADGAVQNILDLESRMDFVARVYP
jgi:hypothetical protein